MPESLELEINDLPPAETLTPEEKERIAGAGTSPRGMLTSPDDLLAFNQATFDQRTSAIDVWKTYGQVENFLHLYAKKITESCGPQFKMIKGPMKSFARAARKDLQTIKDIVRVTIVAPTQQELNTVKVQLEYWGHQPPWSLAKDKHVRAVEDDFHYSGLNYVLQTNQLRGIGRLPFPVSLEIQANVPWMIYGKEVREVFIGMLGGDESAKQEFEKIESWTQIRSGLGHALYEIWEKVGPGDKRKAEELSSRYYTYLRNRVPNGVNDPMYADLCESLEAFFGKFGHFAKHHISGAVSVTPRRPVPPRGPGLQHASPPFIGLTKKRWFGRS